MANRHTKCAFCISLLMGALLPPAQAAVTAQEAATLKTTLTPLGGERAGNADGSIPAWTGSMGLTLPAGYKSGQPRPLPFPDEKPVLVVTAANAASYTKLLSAGQLELFAKYPQTFKMNIYPTHRTSIAPDWVYSNTFDNATKAVLSPDGDGVQNSYGGIPFPIPKTGLEVIWNNFLRWRSQSVTAQTSSYLVGPDGSRQLCSVLHVTFQYPYYAKGERAAFDDLYNINKVTVLEPPALSGQIVLFLYYMNRGNDLYLYLPGQRRMRRAPNLAYDTPNQFISGLMNYDEIDGFFGSPDRYDFKLVGKQELYVLYNTNMTYAADPAEFLTAHHMKPDDIRWEKHRVWVVDATLKPGKRNVDAKRRLYFDEDTWAALESDDFDSSGDLWKMGGSFPLTVPDMPGVYTDTAYMYDFHSGEYGLLNMLDKNSKNEQFSFRDAEPRSNFSAEVVASQAAR